MTFYRYYWLYEKLSNVKLDDFILYLGIVSLLAFIISLAVYPSILKAPIKLFLISLAISSTVFGVSSISHITNKHKLESKISDFKITSIESLRNNIQTLSVKYDSLDKDIKTSLSKEEYIDIVLNIFYNGADYRDFAEKLGDDYVIKSNDELRLKINPKNKYCYDVSKDTLNKILGNDKIYSDSISGLEK